MIDPEAMPSRGVQGSFTKYFTTPSWRTFMCLRCVHGYKCILRCISDASLNIIIDLEMNSGHCQMFFKRIWDTDRMRLYHRYHTGANWIWYKAGILRKSRSRAMSEFREKIRKEERS